MSTPTSSSGNLAKSRTMNSGNLFRGESKLASDVLLVVSTLIAAVTFQAGVNPPGGVWQDRDGHQPGQATYAERKTPFFIFLVFNTLALSASVLMILMVSHPWGFQNVEIIVATVSMMITYASAIYAISPDETVRFRYVFCAGLVPFAIRLVIELYNWSTRPSSDMSKQEHPKE